MDDILKQILGELKELRQGQEAQGQQLTAFNQRLGNLGEGQTKLNQGQEILIERISNLEQGQDELRQGQQKIAKDLFRLAAHVEGEITDKIRGLYDDQKVIKDVAYRIEGKQKDQDTRLNVYWQEIQVLKTKRR